MGINAPLSRKLWLVNIAAKASYGLGMDYVHAWKALFAEWDWDGWIKPQIDYAVGNGVGCNCIRLIGSLEGVFDNTFEQITYNVHWQQLVEYCASLGVYVYFCGGNAPQVSAVSASSNAGAGAAMTDQNIADGLDSVLTGLLPYENLIGIDAIQEANAWGPVYGEASPTARVISIYNKIKASGTALPITFSTYDRWTTQTPGRDWIASIGAALDFLDFHFYAIAGYDASNPLAMADLNYWRSTYPTLDIICGEFGSPESASYDVTAAYFKSVLTVFNSGDQKIRGAGMWASGQGNTTSSDDWGMYSTTLGPRLSRQRGMRAFTGGSIARNN